MSSRRSQLAATIPRFVRPLQEFISTESASGALLFAAAAAALIWANVAGGSYADAWSRHLDINFVIARIDEPLRHWVNDGLMAIFFFVVGLEIKRELATGELASPRRAALPVAAAIGGMAVPAAIYAAINAGGDGAKGWGIPMATDIAFALGVMALLGRRVPLALKVFLLALAIVDDIGAIAVIAVFYTDDLAPGWFALALALIAVIAALWIAGMRQLALHAVLAFVLWLATHESGVHATIAGVALGLMMPAGQAGADEGPSRPLIARLEHVLHPWSSYAIVPLFALANAGIVLDRDAVSDAASSAVAIGAALGLIIGKPAGILLFAWAAVRARIAVLPEGVRWTQLAGAGVIAGVGFTVSLFITALAFEQAPHLVDEAKIGVLAASTVMGAVGFVWLRVASGRATEPLPE